MSAEANPEVSVSTMEIAGAEQRMGMEESKLRKHGSAISLEHLAQRVADKILSGKVHCRCTSKPRRTQADETQDLLSFFIDVDSIMALLIRQAERLSSHYHSDNHHSVNQ